MVLDIVFVVLSKDGVITIARQEAADFESGWTQIDRVSGNITDAMARAREHACSQGAVFTTVGVHWYTLKKKRDLAAA